MVISTAPDLPEPAPVKTIFKEGSWTVDELFSIFPRTLAAGLVNPAPPEVTK